jgi:hypothetical protein
LPDIPGYFFFAAFLAGFLAAAFFVAMRSFTSLQFGFEVLLQSTRTTYFFFLAGFLAAGFLVGMNVFTPFHAQFENSLID